MKETDAFDYLVIGAGSAGSVVAGRLAEAGTGTVCVLEAGGRDWHPALHVPAMVVHALGDPRFDWGFRTAPSPGTAGRSLLQSRGRVVGGSGSINGHVCTRGHRSDYDDWAAAGNPGWSYAEVLPYFKRLERRIGPGDNLYRGRDGPFTVTDIEAPDPLCDAFIAAAGSCGIPRAADYNGAEQDGTAYVQRSIHRGRRVSPAGAFLKPALRNGSLALWHGTHVLRLLFDGRRAVGAVCRRDGRELRVGARRGIVLAAGAVGSPHLLQLSGVGDPAQLRALGIEVRAALPGVGQNLQDHYAARFVFRIKGARSINERVRGLPLLAELARYALFRRGALALTPTLVYVFARSDPGLARGDVQLSFTPASYPGGVWSGLDRFPGATIACWQQRPESRGHVRALDPDPLVPPEIQPNYLGTETDRWALLHAMALARRVAAAPPFADHVIEEVWPGPAAADKSELLDHARATGNSTYHLMGTCGMGPAADPASVVDAELRVHGIEGLRVADTSVIPSMPAANTNLPALMIGERAADIVLGRPPLPPVQL